MIGGDTGRVIDGAGAALPRHYRGITGALLAYSLKPFGHSLNFAERLGPGPLRSQGMPLPVCKWSFMSFVPAALAGAALGHTTAN